MSVDNSVLNTLSTIRAIAAEPDQGHQRALEDIEQLADQALTRHWRALTVSDIRFSYTERGYCLASFKDGNDVACSLQKSSVATEDMIWLGPDEPNPKVFAGDSTGWHDYPLPENVQCTTRMHLTRGQAAQLLPLLRAFVDTGELDLEAAGAVMEREVTAKGRP